jgi:hypothetical protein
MEFQKIPMENSRTTPRVANPPCPPQAGAPLAAQDD